MAAVGAEERSVGLAWLSSRSNTRPLAQWVAPGGQFVADPLCLPEDISGTITMPLESALRRNGLFGDAAQAKAAVRTVEGCLQAALAAAPASLIASKAAQQEVLGLFGMLKRHNRWACLDLLASSRWAAIFDGEPGLYALGALGNDDDFRWRLDSTLLAVQRRLLSVGDYDNATMLFTLGDREEGGCPVTASLAAALCDAFRQPAGASWLGSGLERDLEREQARLRQVTQAICKHGGVGHAAQLVGDLQRQGIAAASVLTLMVPLVCRQAGEEQAAGFCVSIPGFQAACCSALEAMAAGVAGTQRPEAPTSWEVPEDVVADLAGCTSGSHLCWQPFVDFLRSGVKERPPFRFVGHGGDLQANLDHIQSVLDACRPLRAHLAYTVLRLDAVPGGRRKKERSVGQVAGLAAFKTDTVYRAALGVWQQARQDAALVRRVLVAAPPAAAAPLVASPAPAVSTIVEQPPQQQRPEVAAGVTAAAPAAARGVAATRQAAEHVSLPALGAVAGSAAARAAQVPVAAAAAAAPPDVEVAAAAVQPAPVSPGAAAAASMVAPAAPDGAAAAVGPAEAAALASPVSAAAAAAREAALVSPEPAAAAASAQLLETDSVPAAAAAAAAARPAATPRAAPGSVGACGKGSLVQCTLTLTFELCRPLPSSQQQQQQPEEEGGSKPGPGGKQAAGGSTAKKAAGSSTARMRAAAGSSTAKKGAASTAKKFAGPGGTTRRRLAKIAADLKLPSLLLWFKPCNRHLTLEECRELAAEQLRGRVHPTRLFNDEDDGGGGGDGGSNVAGQGRGADGVGEMEGVEVAGEAKEAGISEQHVATRAQRAAADAATAKRLAAEAPACSTKRTRRRR